MDNFDIDSSYNKETGEAIYTITDGVFNFVGRAKCHENDKDLGNELTGMQIAAMRACIKTIQYEREMAIVQVNTLKHCISTMSMSPRYNENSYEAKKIRRELYLAENDLKAIRDNLTAARQFLKKYIDDKDAAYKHIRKLRAKNN